MLRPVTSHYKQASENSDIWNKAKDQDNYEHTVTFNEIIVIVMLKGVIVLVELGYE